MSLWGCNQQKSSLLEAKSLSFYSNITQDEEEKRRKKERREVEEKPKLKTNCSKY